MKWPKQELRPADLPQQPSRRQEDEPEEEDVSAIADAMDEFLADKH